jgi:hypothetical protein
MKGIPIYSMKESSEHKIMHSTQLLNTSFYVNDIYFERIEEDSTFRQRLDQKVDLLYLKSLSRVCNTMIEKEENLE